MPTDSIVPSSPDDDPDEILIDGILPMLIVMEIGANAADFFTACDERLDGAAPFVSIQLAGQFIRSMTEHFLQLRTIQANQMDGDQEQ